MGTARKKLRNTHKFRGLHYGDIFYNLDQAGLIVKIGKELRGNQNLYCLDRTQPLENHDIVFDQSLIHEYIHKNVGKIYGSGLTPHLLKIMDEEKEVKGIPNSFSNLEIPPWFDEGGLKGVNDHENMGLGGVSPNGQGVFEG